MQTPPPLRITSLQNPRIKLAQRLRESKPRRKFQKFLIDGAVEIRRALESGIELESIFVEQPHDLPWLSGADLPIETVRRATQALQLVTPEVLARMSYGERGAFPVAIAHTPTLPLEGCLDCNPQRVLILDRTEKPGNLGACLRTAAACGVEAVLLTNPVCEVFNPNTIRASRGAVFRLPLAVTTTEQAIAACQQWQLPVWAARVDGRQELWQSRLSPAAAVVFGSEADGLGEDWNHATVTSFRIPMGQAIDSLNLSISTAVTLYEMVRQQRPHSSV